jgi:hypothetical protein
VLTHLVATGAVAVGDDLIGSVAGGSVLSRVSRRFGEGVVNGALTARVGRRGDGGLPPAALRPGKRPSVTAIVRRALTGLFPAAGSPARTPMSTDPFHHHPSLRDMIKPAKESFFRDFTPRGHAGDGHRPRYPAFPHP